ncbi:MAG: serine/threonine protein kinase, partial [bacterium]|nr:serine/threonine protein kinase [bacterium]
MTPELWQRAEEILLEVLEAPEADRRQALDRACAGHAELRREVSSLLEAALGADDFIDAPVFSLRSPDPASGGADRLEGSRIGPYRVERLLGRGGMGAVYLAVRADDEFEQRVALKLLKRGMDSDEIVRRFRHERQILASLQHPNIARLLDGGTTEDGLPYFVMDHVGGEPIDEYCDRHRLSVRDRIRLFLKVCAAVHFAHQNLVVHRDLKPGNILVDSGGEPKLLDFGIAKLLSGGPGDAIDLTLEGPRPMTPSYASPEQVRGEMVTTGSDVYSLGVLLYELLSGHKPYRVPSGGEVEVLRAVCEVEPMRPSMALRRKEQVMSPEGSGVAIDPETVSRARGGDPQALARRLSGDLDAIVLKALRKEPELRYASAQEMSEDLRDHLAGLPVRARKGTFTYRLGKLLRRHKLETALAAAVLAMIVGFGVTALQLRDRALRERDRATEVSHFLVDLFQLPDPRVSRGETVTAQALLEKGTQLLDKELEELPEDRAVLMGAIGSAYLGLKLYDQAEPLLAGSLERRRVDRAGTGGDGELVVNLLYLAHARRAGGVSSAAGGDPAALEAEALDIVARRQVNELRLAELLSNHATLMQIEGDLRAAEEFFRQALAMKIRLFGQRHPEVAHTQQNLAQLLTELGRFDAAEELHRQTLDQRIEFHGPKSREVAVTMSSLANVLRDQGHLDEAEKLLRETIEIRREVFGPDDPRVGIGLNNLALLLQARGTYADAEARYLEALELFRAGYGAGHANVGTVLKNLASVRLARGEHASAEATARQAVEIFDAALAEGHWRTAE